MKKNHIHTHIFSKVQNQPIFHIKLYKVKSRILFPGVFEKMKCDYQFYRGEVLSWYFFLYNNDYSYHVKLHLSYKLKEGTFSLILVWFLVWIVFKPSFSMGTVAQSANPSRCKQPKHCAVWPLNSNVKTVRRQGIYILNFLRIKECNLSSIPTVQPLVFLFTKNCLPVKWRNTAYNLISVY